MSKHVSVSSEIREEQKLALKDMSFKQKLLYFWDYYKIHTLVVILVAAATFGIVRDIANSKDYIFYATMLNAFQLDSTAVSDDFAAYAGLDTENYNCYIDTTSTLDMENLSEYDMATTQMIMALVQTGDLDVMVTDDKIFTNYAGGEMFMDLRMAFTEEELAPYRDYLYYVDAAAIAAANEAPPSASMETVTLSSEEQAAVTESHRHPENMTDPVPVGIFVSDAAFVKSTSSYPLGASVYGIMATSGKVENAKAYLEYLWNTTGPEVVAE